MNFSKLLTLAVTAGLASSSITRRDNCSPSSGPLVPIPNDPYTVEMPKDSFIFLGDFSPKPLQDFQNRFMSEFLPAWYNSSLPDVMKQYGVDRGSFNPSPLPGGSIPSNFTSSMLHATLLENIANGTYPNDTQFSIFLPPGKSITAPDGTNISCSGDQGYHNFANQTKVPYTTPYNVILFSCDLASKDPNLYTKEDIDNASNSSTRIWSHEKNEMDAGLLFAQNSNFQCEGADECTGAISTLATPYGNATVQGFYSNATGGCEPASGSYIVGNTTIPPDNTTAPAATTATLPGSAATTPPGGTAGPSASAKGSAARNSPPKLTAVILATTTAILGAKGFSGRDEPESGKPKPGEAPRSAPMFER